MTSNGASVSYETMYSLLQSIGWELSIFVATFSCALLLRKMSSSSQVTTKKCVSPNGSPQLPSKIPTLSGHQKFATTLRSHSEHSGQSGNATRGSSLEQSQRMPRHIAYLVDGIMDNVRQQPGMRASNRILSAYLEHPDFTTAAVKGYTKSTALEVYTALIQGAIRVGKYHLLGTIFDDMIDKNVERPLNLYELAMKQLAGQKQHQEALSMYDRLTADGLEPSTVTCSCLISFAAEVGELHRAIGFFEKLSSITTPSIRAYMSILRVHAKRQDWPASLAILRDMQHRGVAVDSLALNTALATGIAAEQIEAVESLLKEADTSDPPISDTVSYNTLMKGYAQRNDASKAISLLGNMCNKGWKANAITFNTAMDAAVRGSQCSEAWNILTTMRNAGLKPDKFTCSILVKGLSRDHSVANLKCCLQLLSEAGHVCDATLRSTLYHSVLEAAGQEGDSEALMLVLMQMRVSKIQLTSNTYRALSQTLNQRNSTNCFGTLIDQMLAEDVRPHASIFISLFETLVNHGQVEDAIKCFARLRSRVRDTNGSEKGRFSDSAALLDDCCAALIRSLCQKWHEAEAADIYKQIVADGAIAKVDSATVMQLAKLQAEVGKIMEAWKTIEDMMNLGHKPSDSLVQAFLIACTQQANTALPEALLKKATLGKMRLSQSSYVLVFKLYGRCQQLHDALALFQDMTEKQGMEASATTCAALVNVCLECQQPMRALELVLNLPQRCTAELQQDAFDAMAAAAARKGGAGFAQSQRLKEIAEALSFTL